MLLSELSLITQDMPYFKIRCSYFDIAAEISGQEPLWPGSSILVLLESKLQQFASSSWITYGEGKDGVERRAWSGALVKHTVGGVGKAVEVDGVLRGWRRRRAPGEAVEATACSGGEAVKGTLRRRRRASDVGGVKYLKRASGENLLSVEWVTHAPDIYIGGQMRDTRSLRRVTHYF
jgi:hypothetical protein